MLYPMTSMIIFHFAIGDGLPFALPHEWPLTDTIYRLPTTVCPETTGLLRHFLLQCTASPTSSRKVGRGARDAT